MAIWGPKHLLLPNWWAAAGKAEGDAPEIQLQTEGYQLPCQQDCNGFLLGFFYSFPHISKMLHLKLTCSAVTHQSGRGQKGKHRADGLVFEVFTWGWWGEKPRTKKMFQPEKMLRVTCQSSCCMGLPLLPAVSSAAASQVLHHALGLPTAPGSNSVIICPSPGSFWPGQLQGASFPTLSSSTLACSHGRSLCNVSMVPTRDGSQRQQGMGCPGRRAAGGLCWSLSRAGRAVWAPIPSLSCSCAVACGELKVSSHT